MGEFKRLEGMYRIVSLDTAPGTAHIHTTIYNYRDTARAKRCCIKVCYYEYVLLDTARMQHGYCSDTTHRFSKHALWILHGYYSYSDKAHRFSKHALWILHGYYSYSDTAHRLSKHILWILHGYCSAPTLRDNYN